MTFEQAKLKKLKAQRLQIMTAMATLDQSNSTDFECYTGLQKHVKKLEEQIAGIQEKT